MDFKEYWAKAEIFDCDMVSAEAIWDASRDEAIDECVRTAGDFDDFFMMEQLNELRE